MKKIVNSTKKFVTDHKEAIVVGGIASAIIVLQHRGIVSLNEFLKDNDLYETYYTPEEV
jgi:hypothetical protein